MLQKKIKNNTKIQKVSSTYIYTHLYNTLNYIIYKNEKKNKMVKSNESMKNILFYLCNRFDI